MSSKPLWAAAEAAQPARIDSPVPGYGISTPYGKKPNNKTYWQARGHHTGADFGDTDGSGRVRGKPVVAVLPGRVVLREDKVLGKIVLLYADNGDTYWYCHLADRAPARTVKAGDVLGHVGMTGTGAAMGPHLHLEKRQGHTTSWAGKDLDPTW